MAERRDILNIADCYGSSGATHGLFLSRLLDGKKAEVKTEEWPTSARSTTAAGTPLLRISENGVERALFDLDGAVVHLTLAGGRLYASVAADDEELVAASLARLHDRFPAPDPSSAHEVTVTFWTYSPHGPHPSWRTIAVPEWDEIEDNYSAETRSQLAHMMRGFEPAHGGQLILWHGNAGTGKTFGLRALA